MFGEVKDVSENRINESINNLGDVIVWHYNRVFTVTSIPSFEIILDTKSIRGLTLPDSI
ncbi:hypothetical protein ATHSA_0259 [Athalassotoga saccharophila]|nr:hypothetical protein ATHSA_0259 [Athalassotoga saccharophila]